MESKHKLPAYFEKTFATSFLSFLSNRYPLEYPQFDESIPVIQEFLTFLSKPPDLDQHFETAIQAKLLQDKLFNQAKGCMSLHEAGISTSPGQARFVMQQWNNINSCTVIVDSYNRNRDSRSPVMALGQDPVLVEREEGNIARFVRPVHTAKGVILADRIYAIGSPQEISYAFIDFWNADPHSLYPLQLSGSPAAEVLHEQYGRLFLTKDQV